MMPWITARAWADVQSRLSSLERVHLPVDGWRATHVAAFRSVSLREVVIELADRAGLKLSKLPAKTFAPTKRGR